MVALDKPVAGTSNVGEITPTWFPATLSSVMLNVTDGMTGPFRRVMLMGTTPTGRAKKDTVYGEMCVYSSVMGSIKHIGGDIANIVQHLATKENHFEMSFEVGKTIF